MKTLLITCETTGCPANGIEIELATEAETIFCGGCSQQATNIVEKQDAGTTETAV